MQLETLLNDKKMIMNDPERFMREVWKILYQTPTLRTRLMYRNVPLPAQFTHLERDFYNGYIQSKREVHPDAAQISIFKICKDKPIVGVSVIAHELGHMFWGDNKIPVFWGLIYGFVTLLAGAGLAMAGFKIMGPCVMASAVLLFIPLQMAHSRFRERRAERTGVRALLDVLEPHLMTPYVDFWDQIVREERVQKFSRIRSIVKKLGVFTMTHPTCENRMSLILKEIRRKDPNFYAEP